MSTDIVKVQGQHQLPASTRNDGRRDDTRDESKRRSGRVPPKQSGRISFLSDISLPLDQVEAQLYTLQLAAGSDRHGDLFGEDIELVTGSLCQQVREIQKAVQKIEGMVKKYGKEFGIE